MATMEHTCTAVSFRPFSTTTVQLIREFVSGNKSSYYSHELNLVRTDRERINIADHGSLHAILVDAETLSNYSSIPVWDAIDYRIQNKQ